MTRIALRISSRCCWSRPAQAQLRGHGGPVRALAISADGKTAVSGSFDTSAIRWSLTRNAAEQVLRFHEGAVNAVALLPDGRIVTGGADGRSRSGTPGEAAPRTRARRPHRAGRRARGVAGRRDARLGVVGSHHPAVAARRRRAARARRPSAERQRRRVHAGRQARWSAPAMTRRCASGRSTAARRPSSTLADAAQRRRGRAATARSSPAAPTARSIFFSPAGEPRGEIEAADDADHRARDVGRRRAASPPPASAARSRSSTARDAQARAHAGRARPAGVVGRVPARQPHAAHRRRRPHDPPLGCRHRRADRRGGDRRRRRSARRLCRRPRRARCSAPASPATR